MKTVETEDTQRIEIEPSEHDGYIVLHQIDSVDNYEDQYISCARSDVRKLLLAIADEAGIKIKVEE